MYPVTAGFPPTTLPSRPGATFQVAPRVWNVNPADEADPGPPGACDWTIPQTPHRAGTLVGLTDGSVRTLAPGVSPGTFWALVTPAAGDLPGDW